MYEYSELNTFYLCSHEKKKKKKNIHSVSYAGKIAGETACTLPLVLRNPH